MSSMLMPYNKTSYDEAGTYDLVRRVAKCIDELKRAVYPLPNVDKRGHSDCPFSEEWYAKAEAWSDELKEQIRQLQDHSEGAQRAMVRCKKAKSASFKDDDPRHTDDWKRHDAEYEKHREKHKRIQLKIEEARKALASVAADVAGRSGVRRRIG